MQKSTAMHMFETAAQMLYCSFPIILPHQNKVKETMQSENLINKK